MGFKALNKFMAMVVRILKYLAGTKALGLVYTRKPGSTPSEAFVDAAFADDPSMKSAAGWVFQIHGAVTADDSSTIKRIVTSTTEAECMAITVVGKENTWQRQMYLDISNLKAAFPPTPVHGDNTASISLLSTDVTKNTRSYSLD